MRNGHGFFGLLSVYGAICALNLAVNVYFSHLFPNIMFCIVKKRRFLSLFCAVAIRAVGVTGPSEMGIFPIPFQNNGVVFA